MSAHDYGGGRIASPIETQALRRPFGDWQAPLDLNRASIDALVRAGLLDQAAAAATAALRQSRPVDSPSDLLAAGIIDAQQLAAVAARSYGASPAKPMLTHAGLNGARAYVDEPFDLDFHFTTGTTIAPEILSVEVRFPSGRVARLDRRLPADAIEHGTIRIGPFMSRRAGEFFVAGTLRDEAGGVHRLGGAHGVFTRNPVIFCVAPTHSSQSGSAGAPKYDFGANTWTCYVDVAWINGTDEPVNLGRTVSVRVTDAGAEIGSFAFDLAADIVVPPWETVYGNFYTWHGEGSPAFGVFSAKGDLIFEYSMSGSGHAPDDPQIWRVMRVIGYNIIRVGDFTQAERDEYQSAAGGIASSIFEPNDMTVHGVELYRIEGSPEFDADKARFRFIDSQAEADEMAALYAIPNWYLDVFFVEGRWDGALGSSYVDGPVDKQGETSGIVLVRDNDTVNLGQTFAHEAGHYLGLKHADEDDGVADTDPADPYIGENFLYTYPERDSVYVTAGQIDRMRLHGLVWAATP